MPRCPSCFMMGLIDENALRVAGVAAQAQSLLALNQLQEASTGIGAGATIAQNSTGTITRQRQGKVDVTVQASFLQVTGTGAGNVTLTLQRDGATIVGAPTAKATIATDFAELSLSWTDTLPDAAAHHYGWSATTDNGTISVASGQASVRAREVA